YMKEKSNEPMVEHKEALGIDGGINLLLILGVIGAVLFSGTVKLGEFIVYNVHVSYQNAIRDVVLLLLAGLSLLITSKENREANGFNWFPIQEVGKLFAGIFITIITPIAMLKAATEGQGALQFINDAVFTNG